MSRHSSLCVGHVWHNRLAPARHAFRYPAYVYAFDLDELPALDRASRVFGHNRRALVALRDADYLGTGPGALRARLRAALAARPAPGGPLRVEDAARIVLVTSARCGGYVFNPVSFFYCFDAAGALLGIVAEVNNTFGDRHVYVLDRPLSPPGAWPARFEHPKEFHVSPFNDRRGDYLFAFADIRRELDIRVELRRDGAVMFKAGLRGALTPWSDRAVLGTLARYPLTALLTVPRITWQAARLFYQRRLPVYRRPAPAHPLTLRVAPPTRLERLACRLALRFLGRVARGHLTLTLPDGATRAWGDPATGRAAALRVRDWRFFGRLVFDGDTGFGESFMAGEWDSPDATALLMLLAENMDTVDDRRLWSSWLGRAGNRLRHALRRNTTRMSRRNIREHYDLSNAFFSLWLDPTMMYSCAIFESPGDTLEQAQRRRLARIIARARIRPGHHVLEIGSGWGGFALAAARQTGCRVTSITLSERQLEFARARARAEGLDQRVRFELCDYRHMTGAFDRIVSIEMLEAVGHEYYGAFFAQCDRLLKPDGLVFLQVITIPDQRYDDYRRAGDWIQKHIFPGGLLPSLTVLSRAMTRHSRLWVESLENIGPHYARTLREWREAFAARRAELERLGYDEAFQRKWEYYFRYCEAGFATRRINNLHLLLTRSGNPALAEPAAAANDAHFVARSG